MKYGYQMQHMGAARQALMLPLREGRAEAIARCLHHCHIAFDDAGINQLAHENCESALKWKAILERYITACDQQDWSRDYLAKLTDDQVDEIASALDELTTAIHYWYAQSCG